jgi:L-lactate dehydrogenase complex protein LldG
MSAREEVLARVRAAAADAVAPIVPRDYDRLDDAAADLDLLVDRLADYRAEVHRCGPDELSAVLARLLTGRVLVPDGFDPTLVVGLDVLPDAALTPYELDAVDVVVTSCALAIATTGTVVLDGGLGQGRRAATLVPDRHVVVVREEQVVQTVPQALARLDPTRPQTWISGPSATSDIELERVEGVHGPRTLIVVLVS